MNRKIKTVLGVLGGLVVMCACASLSCYLAWPIAGNILEEAMFIDEPTEVARIAQTIVDYELPPDHQEEMALNFFFGHMVMFTKTEPDPGTSSNRIIALLQFSSLLGSDPEEVQQTLRNSMEQQMSRGEDLQLELVEQTITNIRDQTVPLTIYEGVDKNGVAVREVVIGLFESKTGPAMLIFIGSIPSWNQTEIDTFIQSIE